MKAVMRIGIVLLGLLCAVNAMAAEVVQGECIQYNTETKIIKVREYDTNFSQNRYGNPTSIESEFDVSAAKIGATPDPGNIVRIAYNIEGNKKVAIKVMNVTKQDLNKK